MFEHAVENAVKELQEQINELRRQQMAFADSIAKLQGDVATLINEVNPAATAAAVAAAVTSAVAAKDAADAAAVDAIDAKVQAAITPAPVVPPATPAA